MEGELKMILWILSVGVLGSVGLFGYVWYTTNFITAVVGCVPPLLLGAVWGAVMSVLSR